MSNGIPCWRCNKEFPTHLDYDIHSMSVYHHQRLEQTGQTWHTCPNCNDFSCSTMAEYVEHSETDEHWISLETLRGIRFDITDEDDQRKREKRLREMPKEMPPARKKDFVLRGQTMKNTRASSNKSNQSEQPSTPTNSTTRASTPKGSTGPALPRGENTAQKRARSRPGPKPTSTPTAAPEKSSEPPAKKTPAKKSPIKKPPPAPKKDWERPITRNAIASRNMERYSTRRRQAYVRVDPNSSADEASSSSATPTPMNVLNTNASASMVPPHRLSAPIRPNVPNAPPRNSIASRRYTPAPSHPVDLARHQEELSTTLNAIQSIRQPMVPPPAAAAQQQPSNVPQQMPTVRQPPAPVRQPSAPVPRQATPPPATQAPVLPSFPPAPVQHPPPAAQVPPAQLPPALFVPGSGSMGIPMGNPQQHPQPFDALPSSTPSPAASEPPVLLSIGAMHRRIKQENDRDIIAIPGPLERQLEIGRLAIEEERLKRTLDAKRAECTKLMENIVAWDVKWNSIAKETTNGPQNLVDACYLETMQFFKNREAYNEKAVECDMIEKQAHELRLKRDRIVEAASNVQ